MEVKNGKSKNKNNANRSQTIKSEYKKRRNVKQVTIDQHSKVKGNIKGKFLKCIERKRH